MKTVMNALSLVAALSLGGVAQASPDETSQAPQAHSKPRGHFRDQASAHPKQFHGDPSMLEHCKLGAAKAHALGEAVSREEAKAAGVKPEDLKRHSALADNSRYTHPTGFSGAMKRLERLEARASQDQSRVTPGNDASADKAQSEEGDLAPSEGGTGPKRVDQAAIAARHRVIANDFTSARHQVAAGEARSMAHADAKLHLSAGAAQQITQGDKGEMAQASGHLDMRVVASGPQLGAHNNFGDATARARASSPFASEGATAHRRDLSDR